MLLFHKDMGGLKVKVGEEIVEVSKDGFVEIADEKAIRSFLNTGFSVSKGKKFEKKTDKKKAEKESEPVLKDGLKDELETTWKKKKKFPKR